MGLHFPDEKMVKSILIIHIKKADINIFLIFKISSLFQLPVVFYVDIYKKCLA